MKVRVIVGLFLGAFWMAAYKAFIMPDTLLDELLITIVGKFAMFFLKIFGYNVIFQGRDFLIGESGLWIGDNCSALEVIGIFIIFSLIIPGKLWFNFFYLCFGTLLIIFLNALRIAFLGISLIKFPVIFEYSHTIFFNVVVYLVIIFLIWWKLNLGIGARVISSN